MDPRNLTSHLGEKERNPEISVCFENKVYKFPAKNPATLNYLVKFSTCFPAKTLEFSCNNPKFNKINLTSPSPKYPGIFFL